MNHRKMKRVRENESEKMAHAFNIWWRNRRFFVRKLNGQSVFVEGSLLLAMFFRMCEWFVLFYSPTVTAHLKFTPTKCQFTHVLGVALNTCMSMDKFSVCRFAFGWYCAYVLRFPPKWSMILRSRIKQIPNLNDSCVA